MVLFDKNRNMVIKTSILTNTPNISYKKKGGGNTFILTLKNDPERKYITSTDLEMLFDESVKDNGYLVETDLKKATSNDFPYIVIDEVAEDIVLCTDGKFRVYGYSDEKPFTLFDGSSEKLKDKFWGKNIANVRNECTTRKGVLYKGEHFPNYKTFCERIGVSPIILGDRIRRGKTLEEAVETEGYPPIEIEYKGKLYSSQAEIARAFGIAQNLLNFRLNNGMDLEEALHTPVREKHEYVCEGRTIDSEGVREYCQKYGVNEGVVKQYYLTKEKSDIKDIVKGILQRKDKKIVTYHGKEYSSLPKAISDLKIKETPSAIKNRMEKHGMSFEEVVDADPRIFKSRQIFQYKDKVYYSFKELSEGVNIPEGTLRKRLKNGMSVEEAVEAPKNQRVKNQEVITYKGEIYKKWSEFFEKNPLFKRARGSIQERRQKGMSIEEALDDYAKSHFVTDHKGNVFRNQKERSLKYSLSPATVRNRLNSGWSLEQSLAPIEQKDNSKEK